MRRQAGTALDQQARPDDVPHRLHDDRRFLRRRLVAAGSDGKLALVSNTSIGPVTAGWLAGPRLGKEAKGIYSAVSKKFAGQ